MGDDADARLSIDEVEQRRGFSSAAILRQRFHAMLGVSPGSYRESFGAAALLGTWQE